MGGGGRFLGEHFFFQGFYLPSQTQGKEKKRLFFWIFCFFFSGGGLGWFFDFNFVSFRGANQIVGQRVLLLHFFRAKKRGACFCGNFWERDFFFFFFCRNYFLLRQNLKNKGPGGGPGFK